MDKIDQHLNKLYGDLNNACSIEQIEFSTIKTFYEEFFWILSRSLMIKKNQKQPLVDCCLLFAECIGIFLGTHQSSNTNQLEILKKCLEIIVDVSEFEDVKDWYILYIGIPLLQMVTRPDTLNWFNKELLKNLNVVAKNSSERLRYTLVTENVYHFCKLIDELCANGDFEYQMILLETIFIMFSDELIQRYSQQLFPESQNLKQSFCEINRSNLYYESRKFLNVLNSTFKDVLSFKFKFGIMDNDQIQPPKNFYGDSELWVDFNTTSKMLSIPCSKDSFLSNKMLENDNEIELIKILFEDITMVKMSKLMANNSNCARGSLILFKLNNERLILSSQNITKSNLKLIVFNSSDIEVLEKHVLPLLFEDKFEKFVLSSQEDTIDDEDDDGKPYNFSVEEYQPRKVKKTIFSCKVSGSVETSSVSDALSLRSKLQDFDLINYNVEKVCLSKRPDIKNVEQLVNITRQQNFNQCNTTENEETVANNKNEDLESQEFESMKFSIPNVKNPIKANNVQTGRDTTLDCSFFTNNFELISNSMKVNEIRPHTSVSECSTTNSIDSSQSEELNTSLSNISGMRSQMFCKDPENNDALDTKLFVPDENLLTFKKLLSLRKENSELNLGKKISVSNGLKNDCKEQLNENNLDTVDLPTNKPENLLKISIQDFSNKSDCLKFNRCEEQMFNLDEVIEISDDDDNYECLIEKNHSNLDVQSRNDLMPTEKVLSTKNDDKFVGENKISFCKNSNCLELDKDESDIFNFDDVKKNHTTLSNQSKQAFSTSSITNINASHTSSEKNESLSALENDLIKILAACDNEDQNTYLALASKQSSNDLQDNGRSHSPAKIVSQEHEFVNLDLQDTVCEVNALIENNSNEEDVLLHKTSTGFQNTHCDSKNISLHDSHTILLEPCSQGRNSVKGSEEFLQFQVNNSSSEIIVDDCLRDTNLCNTSLSNTLQLSPVQNVNSLNMDMCINLNSSEICNNSLQSHSSLSALKRKLDVQNYSLPIENDTDVHKYIDKHIESNSINDDELIITPIEVPIKETATTNNEILPKNNSQEEVKYESKETDKHFRLKEVSVSIELAAQEAINQFIKKQNKENLLVTEQISKKKIKTATNFNQDCKNIPMKPELPHTDNYDKLKTTFKDNVNINLNPENDDKNILLLKSEVAKVKINSSGRRGSIYSEGSAKKFKLYNPNNPISIDDSSILKEPALNNSNNHDAKQESLKPSKDNNNTKASGRRRSIYSEISSKKFKLYNPNNPISIDDSSILKEQSALINNNNHDTNQLLEDLQTTQESLEPSKDNNNTEINLLDIEKNNNVGDSVSFVDKHVLHMEESFKVADDAKNNLNTKNRTTRKINIIQHIILQKPKAATLETSTRKKDKVQLEKYKLNDTYCKSSKFISLLESLCPHMPMNNEAGYKKRNPYTSKILNKKLFKKEPTRYSKLNVDESNDRRTKIKKTNDVVNNCTDTDFIDALKTYSNNCEKLNKVLMDSTKKDKNDAVVDPRSFSKGIIQTYYDTYGLLQQAVSSFETNDSKSKAILSVLGNLRNKGSEYLTKNKMY